MSLKNKHNPLVEDLYKAHDIVRNVGFELAKLEGYPRTVWELENIEIKIHEVMTKLRFELPRPDHKYPGPDKVDPLSLRPSPRPGKPIKKGM